MGGSSQLLILLLLHACHTPQVTEPAPLGCYVHGLVLEGAAWDREEGRLKDSAPGQLRQQMPVIQVGWLGDVEFT